MLGILVFILVPECTWIHVMDGGRGKNGTSR